MHYKYIVAAAQLKQWKEVERVARDSTVYDPVAVRDFLLDAKLPDPRPLIHVCDRFGFTEELTAYLYNNKLQKVRARVCARPCMRVQQRQQQRACVQRL